MSQSERTGDRNAGHLGWVRELLSWFDEHGKTYPFRNVSDPFRILISELLLHQTTAKQVSNIYSEFFRKYPTPEVLTFTSVKDLSKILKPLGIRSRVRLIKRIARVLVRDYAGKVPETLEGLTTLDGVGAYTAACVLTFGYGKPTPMLDVNTSRVLSRIYGLGKSANSGKRAGSIYRDILIANEPSRVHYAIIDLAHAVCRPKEPLCAICPCIQSCVYAGATARTNLS